MFIDISKDNVLNLYSKDELISYAEKGLLVCGDVDLSGFVEKISNRDVGLTLYTQQELDDAVEEALSERDEEIMDWIRYH